LCRFEVRDEATGKSAIELGQPDCLPKPIDFDVCARRSTSA
jgi:hypothetical protein